MNFTHHEINREGKGLERVANIYVAKDFDIRAKPAHSEEFLSLMTREEIPEYIQNLIRRVMGTERSES